MLRKRKISASDLKSVEPKDALSHFTAGFTKTVPIWASIHPQILYEVKKPMSRGGRKDADGEMASTSRLGALITHAPVAPDGV